MEIKKYAATSLRIEPRTFLNSRATLLLNFELSYSYYHFPLLELLPTDLGHYDPTAANITVTPVTSDVRSLQPYKAPR